MKPIIRLLLLSCLSFNVYAQNTDSISFSKLKWAKKSIAKKTTLSTFHVNDSSIFKANQFISFIEVKKHSKAPGIFIGYEDKKLTKASTFGKKYKSIALVNGTFFDMKKGGSVDFIKVNDTVINQTLVDKNKRALHQKSALLIDEKGLSIKKWDGTADWENKLPAPNVMVSGPLLILNNEVQKLDSVAFNTNRHPRTAVGIKANGNVVLLTVDGRRKESMGMTMNELTKVMKWLGCEDAINLDGGGSTTLWVKNFGDNGVVNYPSDNKMWDHEGERGVANVIFIKSKGKQ
jgi:exopolysaccharide biosynthesis protein